MEQHERAIAAYVDSVRGDETALAVIVVGSVARGAEREDSDVDVYLVVDDARFAAASEANRIAWIERAGLDYPGSYIDIKLCSPGYLASAAERGDDPTRASFTGARVAWHRIDGIDPLIEAITVLPDWAWAERVRSHVAQVRLHGGYFLRQAAERGDAFLLHHAATHMALAAARAAFANARVLLQGPKYVTATLSAVPTPDGFVDAWDAAVRNPGIETAETLLAQVDRWLGGGMDGDEALSTFIRDNELAWLRGTVPAEYF